MVLEGAAGGFLKIKYATVMIYKSNTNCKRGVCFFFVVLYSGAYAHIIFKYPYE
jgi:hypothetical protein